MIQPKTLPEWLHFALGSADRTKPNGEPAACIALSMVHINGQSEKEIDSVKLAGQKFDDQKIQMLANRFLGIAETDAQNISGRQEYCVYAYYEGNEQMPGARYRHAVNGRIVNAPGDHSTEPPTVEGRMMQRMRHDEAYSQVLITANANLINQQSNLLNLMNAHLTEAKRENRDMFAMMHELMLEKVKVDREHEMRMASYQRTSEMMKKAAEFAPMILNTITGREIVPQSSVDTAILKTIAESIDEEAMQHLAPVMAKLPPQATAILMGRLEQLLQEKKATEQRAAQIVAHQRSDAMAQAELDEEPPMGGFHA